MRDLAVFVHTDEYGRETVTRAFTCPHCGKVNRMEPGSERYFCVKHMLPTCPTPACANACDDLRAKFDRMDKLAAHRRLRGY